MPKNDSTAGLLRRQFLGYAGALASSGLGAKLLAQSRQPTAGATDLAWSTARSIRWTPPTGSSRRR